MQLIIVCVFDWNELIIWSVVQNMMCIVFHWNELIPARTEDFHMPQKPRMISSKPPFPTLCPEQR